MSIKMINPILPTPPLGQRSRVRAGVIFKSLGQIWLLIALPAKLETLPCSLLQFLIILRLGVFIWTQDFWWLKQLINLFGRQMDN